MKALLINTSFYPNIGGVENSFRSISEALYEEGWEIDIIASDNKIHPSLEHLFGAKIIRYNQLNFGFSFISIMKLLIKNNYKEYDLIISRNLITSFILNILRCKHFNYIVPGIYKNQNKTNTKNIIKRIKYKINCIIEKITLKNTPNLFVFSESMKEQINDLVKNKEIKLITPGVDINRFKQCPLEEKTKLRKNLNLPQDKKIILGIGRFYNVKNFATLITSMKDISEEFCLVLVGEGPEKIHYENLIKTYELSNKVFIFPKTKTPEVFYQLSDLFCLPSTYEPFGQVLLEASCSGLHIIALDDEDENINTATKEIYFNFPELINFIPQNNPESFSKTINNLLLTTSVSSSSLDDFRKNYSWSLLINKLNYKNN